MAVRATLNSLDIASMTITNNSHEYVKKFVDSKTNYFQQKHKLIHITAEGTFKLLSIFSDAVIAALQI